MQVTIQIKNVNQIEALKALFLAGQTEPVTPAQPVAKPVPVAEQAPVPVEPTTTEAVAPAPVKKGRSRSTKDTLPPPPVAVPTEQEFVTNKVEEAKPVAPATKEPATAPKAEAKPVEATVQSSYEDVKKAFIQVMKAFGSEQDTFKKWMMDKFGITNGKELTPDRYTEALLIAEQTIKEVKGEATAEDFM